MIGYRSCKGSGSDRVDREAILWRSCGVGEYFFTNSYSIIPTSTRLMPDRFPIASRSTRSFRPLPNLYPTDTRSLHDQHDPCSVCCPDRHDFYPTDTGLYAIASRSLPDRTKIITPHDPLKRHTKLTNVHSYSEQGENT